MFYFLFFIFLTCMVVFGYNCVFLGVVYGSGCFVNSSYLQLNSSDCLWCYLFYGVVLPRSIRCVYMRVRNIFWFSCTDDLRMRCSGVILYSG